MTDTPPLPPAAPAPHPGHKDDCPNASAGNFYSRRPEFCPCNQQAV